jgi:hypothetical protein
MTEALNATPTNPVFAPTSPTLHIDVVDANAAAVSPPLVKLDVTTPAGVTTTYTITASSTGVFEKQPDFATAGKWRWTWKLYAAADATDPALTVKYFMRVN